MSTVLQRLANRWLKRAEVVPLSNCVHFCGFRYGMGEYNPYETYLHDITFTGDREAARRRFVDFLRYYRPKDLGEALGVDLERHYNLWCYPWTRRMPPSGWHDDPASCPDILTNFSSRGVLLHRIEEEFGWLERSLDSICEHGYQPRKFGSQLCARKLVRADGECRYLLEDGNHRVAALSALGEQTVTVSMLPIKTVRETDLLRWPQVRRGSYSTADARSVLHAYFDGNQRVRTTEDPADILEAAP